MRKTTWIASLVIAVLLGAVAGRFLWPAQPANQGRGAGEPEPLYWVAPMDPTYKRDEPGKSPMGMDLVPVYPGDQPGEKEAPGTVRISPAVVNNLGVKTAPAERGSLRQRVETVGYVQYDEDKLDHIHTRVEGWIEKLHVKASGDPVKKGEALFELYSRPLVTAQEEFLSARDRGNEPLLSASRERLAALGLNSAQIGRLERTGEVRRLIPEVAEHDGFVADLRVREGMFVKPDTEVMSIAALDTVWVIAEVFERQVAWLEVGQSAEVRFDYLPGRSWEGEVDYIYPELDPDTRTARVRIELPNPGITLKPNMFADVVIHGTQSSGSVHVPRQALIRGGRLDRVVIDTGDGRFRAVPVEVGIESGDRVAILSGIEAGQSVVVSGQFLIDSEANLAAELMRAEDAETGGTGAGDAMSGMDHGATEQGATEQGATEQGEMDHGEMDHGEMDHGGMNAGEKDQEKMDQGQMDQGDLEEEGMDREDGP